MLKALFRVRLASLKSMLTGASRSKKKRSKLQILGFMALMLYAFVALGFFFFTMFFSLAEPFHTLGMGWLYFALAALMSFALMFVGSVFTAKTQLYEARDNDLLLSMPVKPGYILVSRMFLLWVIDLAMALLVAVPVLVAWLLAVGTSTWLIVSWVALYLLLLPLLALIVSALFGWLLHLATARVGNKSLVTVVLSLAFMGVYFYFVSRMNVWVERLAQDPAALAGRLGSAAPLVWIGRAMAEQDLPALLGLAAGILLIFAAGCFVLARSFLRTATSQRSAAKKKYVERTVEAVSPRRALLRRELKRLAASPAYILNGALGALFALIAAVFLLIRRQDVHALMAAEFIAPLLPLFALVALCYMAATVLITAPSISLEGKSLWIVKSLPVEPRELLLTKLRLHLLVGLPPMLFASAAAALVLEARGLTLLGLVLIPAAYVVFTGLLGLFENLRHPNFDWINEAQAVKSGASILLTMFISWGVLVPPILVFVIWGRALGAGPILTGYLALLALCDLLLYRWLLTRGVKKFLAL